MLSYRQRDKLAEHIKGLLEIATRDSSNVEEAREAWKDFKATFVLNNGMTIDAWLEQLEKEKPDLQTSVYVTILQTADRYILEHFFELPPLEPGVVRPSGGPYDAPHWQRADMGGFDPQGRMRKWAFPEASGKRKKRRAKVTVSVEGFPKPLTFRAGSYKNDDYTVVLGHKTIKGVEYAFSPATLRWPYDDIIDESKPWHIVGEPTKSRRKAPQSLLPWERDWLDAYVLNEIDKQGENYLTYGDRSTPFTTAHDLFVTTDYWGIDIPEAESKAAQNLHFDKKSQKSAYAASIKRLLKKGLIYEGETPGLRRSFVKGYAPIKVREKAGTFWDYPR